MFNTQKVYYNVQLSFETVRQRIQAMKDREEAREKEVQKILAKKPHDKACQCGGH